mmetsp:Transcript_16952/g.34890  ORF Transcript_16952/g.34890 Transcript_16952/m.34890 type:complete len:324 (+) Transcript_16952:321-1292(+)
MRDFISRLLVEVIKQTTPEEPDTEILDDDVDGNDDDTDTIILVDDVTTFEKWMDVAFGVAFLITAIIAAKRMTWTRQQPGAETTVVSAFYSLILVTSIFRSIWFLIPAEVWTPSYTPVAIYAWDNKHPAWIGAFLSEFVLTAGSLALFSIFILILVYWADILKKYFLPGSRRSIPMVTFLGLVFILVALEICNIVAFSFGLYTTEGMILFNSVLLAFVSIVCVCEITVFFSQIQNCLEDAWCNQSSLDGQPSETDRLDHDYGKLVLLYACLFGDRLLCVLVPLLGGGTHGSSLLFSSVVGYICRHQVLYGIGNPITHALYFAV